MERRGPVSLEEAEEWRNAFGWKDWMAIIEALFTSMLLNSSTSLHQNSHPHKSDYDLVRRRMLGDTRLEEAIDQALEICRTPETRDLALEGRLRMERGLQRFER